MSGVLTILIAFISIIIPGFFLALALLKKTKLNMFEITVMGFIFGLIFPPTLTWLESYLIQYVHVFSFSSGLYAANVILLTIIGIVLSFQQGAISTDFLRAKTSGEVEAQMRKDYRARLAELRGKISSLNIDISLVKEHEREEKDLARQHAEEMRRLRDAGPEQKVKVEAIHREEEKRLIEAHEDEEKLLLEGVEKKGKKGKEIVWLLLLLFMLFAFATRMLSIGIAPKFFEFDPYFDMQSTESILVNGAQWLYDHSAWPTAINGTAHRIEPIVPYLEAYWYDISNPPSNAISLNLLSNVSSFYPPIVAALLVFVVFVFLYHIYGEFSAIIGAALATAMPALITTFIAGEQLVEPWGIFAMFFFYAAYLLAVQDMKETRFAVLAGIAFASTFLGAHYYTVNAGVLAAYIVLQGIAEVLRKENTRDFFKMNLIVIGIIVLFYVVFDPYNSVLADKIPSYVGIPVIISFPLLALAIVAMFEYVPVLAQKHRIVSRTDFNFYIVWLVILLLVALALVFFTPLGNPVKSYLALSSHFTTPSIPLFMTVQEYEPTGFNFNFGSAGFGIIGASIFGVNIIVWLVLVIFTLLAFIAVYKRNSRGSILAWAAVIPLAVAGMIEIKYLPHFGVGYIIAIGMIIGELLLITKGNSGSKARKSIIYLSIIIVLAESIVFISIFAAASNQNCNTISSSGNSVGFNLYCNVVPNYWLQATSWMYNNVGPYAPRILSWWDYGDWINWFGNSNAVLRGDNSIATLDYATAARFVLGSKDGYGPSNLASFANSVQAKYVLFDDQLTQKWQALDFLACVDVNQTSRAFAIQQAANSSTPYILGTSQCELSHDPAYLLIPLNTNNINNYCQVKNKSIAALKSMMIVGSMFTNQTFCAPLNTSTSAPIRLLDSNGSKTNVLLVPSQQFFYGVVSLGGQQFANFMVLYLPNGPNNTITNAPSQFYNSNYYRGFYLGQLPGFKIAYPSNFTGINYVNGTHQVVIFQLNNYTGSLPYVTPKPQWIRNNFTMPG